MGVQSAAESLKVRQDILQKIKNQVQSYLGKEPSSLRRYALSYKKNIERSRWKPSSIAEVLGTMNSSQVIFGGDFHAFSQAQRVHLRLLRELTQNFSMVLAVECIQSRFQKVLDLFIQGKIQEDEFLRRVQWNKAWGFRWENYKPLFELIRQRGGRCLALNIQKPMTLKGLRERDQHAALLIANGFKTLKSTEKIYVIYGDLHIAQDNLPTLTLKKTHKKAKTVTLYLNPEKIYFQLFKKNLENKINVVQFSKSEYCLLESPPWVKWQSYLLYLEENTDYALEMEELDFGEHLQSLIRVLSMDMGLSFDKDFSVSSFRDHDFLDLLSEVLTKENYAIAHEFVENDMNFFDPGTRRAYLARSTVNYAAQLAGHIFHSHLCGLSSLAKSFPSDFEKQIWLESVGFFFSKLINPHRKSPTMNDLKKQLAAFSPQDKGEHALKLALDQKMRELLFSYEDFREGDGAPLKRSDSRVTYLHASKILGSMLGEKIYTFYKTRRLSRSLLHKWLRQSVEHTDFRKFYIQVLKEIDKLGAGDMNGI